MSDLRKHLLEEIRLSDKSMNDRIIGDPNKPFTYDLGKAMRNANYRSEPPLTDREISMLRELNLDQMKADADALASANRRAKWAIGIFGVVTVAMLAVISCVYLGVFI